MESAEYLIVGSGLTGSVIARLLADAGRDVLIVEKRNHLGGNIYDYDHHSGIRVQAYGPHYFRCNSIKIWDFVNRFSRFYKDEARIKTFVDDNLEDWPVNLSYLNRLNLEQRYPSFKGIPNNFEEVCLSKMPLIVYNKFVRDYTSKQWGVDLKSLDSDLADRISIRKNHENRLTPKRKFQGIPCRGYNSFIENLLDGIPRKLNYKFKPDTNELSYSKKLIYSGPIDEFFQFKFGHLQYRGQLRETLFLPNIKYYQPYAQINNPNPENGSYIRTIEWKHFTMPDNNHPINGTVITKEYPFDPIDSNNYEYPLPDIKNSLKYKQYRKLANKLKDVIICGRLGEYRYYDMDRVIERAMLIAREILVNNS